MRRPRIVALGEILWDLLPQGPVLGGAPANFAFHATALGAEGRLISRVGNDELGRQILEKMPLAGLPAADLQIDSQAPTGTVSVTLAADGQPSYVIHENVAWDRIEADAAARAVAARADVVCFGSLAQRSSVSWVSIRELLAVAPADALRIFDINLRQHFYSREIIEQSLRDADVLKLNDQELPILAQMFDLTGDTSARLSSLITRFGLRGVALTCGSEGSLLSFDGEVSQHPGVATTVRDTIGAGDAFTAALAMGLLAGWPLAVVNERANRLAAFVCSVDGATPPLPAWVRSLFQDSGAAS